MMSDPDSVPAPDSTPQPDPAPAPRPEAESEPLLVPEPSVASASGPDPVPAPEPTVAAQSAPAVNAAPAPGGKKAREKKPNKTVEKLIKLRDEKLLPLFEKAVNYINARNPREKIMIIAFAAAFVLFVDYWILMRPIIHAFRTTMPQLAELDNELKALRHDKKNKELVARQWQEAQDSVADRERSFIAPDELPSLLENLSQLALDSNVKILTLKPAPELATEKKESRYTSTPIKISALAGTHEFGKFVAKLESGTTFFRVMNMTIRDNSPDIKRHRVDLDLEVYSRAQ